MEAVRPAQDRLAVVSDTQGDVEELPPPPEPFPVDQLHRDAEVTTTIHYNLAPIQSSCIAVLGSLLPPDDLQNALGTLNSEDGQLAATLVQLLETSYILEAHEPSPNYEDHHQNGSTGSPNPNEGSRIGEDQFSHLERELQEVISESAVRQQNGNQSNLISGDQERLAALAGTVIRLLEERRNSQHRVAPATTSRLEDMHHEDIREDPPSYSLDLRRGSEHLPSYLDNQHLQEDKPKDKVSSEPSGSRQQQQQHEPPTSNDEKMELELDGVTSAIERLQTRFPRLQDQRVEMRATSSKVTLDTPISLANSNNWREKKLAERNKMKELEEIWDRIERAHGKRKMRDDMQRFDMNGMDESRALQRERFLQTLYDKAEASRMSDQDSSMRLGGVNGAAKERDLQARDKFYGEVMDQSAERRFANQDAEQGFKDAFPMTLDDRLAERREQLFSDIFEYSSSGRLAGQDSAPPTPTSRQHDPHELVTMQDFFRRGQVGLNGHSRSMSSSAAQSEDMTTMQKIKGLVQRRSMAFGLKVSTGNFDISGISYIAEHQENLRTIQVMISGNGLPLRDGFTLETSGSKDTDEAIVTMKGSGSLAIRLPSLVPPKQSVQLSSSHLHLEGRLSAAPTATTAISLNTFLSPPLPASELRALQPTAICCTACDREIADLSHASSFEHSSNGGRGFKDLPSEHWAEMMEVWMCNSDPSFTARLSKHTEQGFWPSKGTVLVGGSYLLVHPGDVKRHNISVEESNKDDIWEVVTCSCGEVLGKQRTNNDRPGAGTFRFSKWSIALLREDEIDGESVEPLRYPLSVFIVSDMLELAQAHASYRFFLTDEDSGQQRILIWLFNPSVRISYRRTSPPSIPSPIFPTGHSRRNSVKSDKSFRSNKSNKSNKSTKSTKSKRSSMNSSPIDGSAQKPSTTITPVERIFRAARVMYKVVQDEQDALASNLPGFGPTVQVETLTYPSQVIERLIASLRESTSFYPSSRRTMGNFDVGFLERC